MAELFESYASDFAQLQQSIEARLGADVEAMSAEARRAALRSAEAEADEASEILSQMDIEVQGFPQSVRSRYVGDLERMHATLERLQESVRAKYGAARGAGVPPGGASGSYTDGDDLEAAHGQRQRLLQGTSTLDQGTRRLEESNRLALETEDVGAGILRDLRGQREQIEHSRDTVRRRSVRREADGSYMARTRISTGRRARLRA